MVNAGHEHVEKGNGKDGLTRESTRDHVPFRPRVLQPTLLSALSAFTECIA